MTQSEILVWLIIYIVGYGVFLCLTIEDWVDSTPTERLAMLLIGMFWPLILLILAVYLLLNGESV